MIENINYRHEKWHNIPPFWKSSREIGNSLTDFSELSDSELKTLKNYLVDNTYSSITLSHNKYISRLKMKSNLIFIHKIK